MASAREGAPLTLAAIDVGTNSLHMVVARIGERAGIEVLTREKAIVRLGSGLDGQGVLSEAAQDRGIDALGRCAAIAAERNADVVAVGTSALREAVNREVFLARARTEAGIDLEVINGREEARLIYLGALQSLSVYDAPLVLVDIGGGSTEVLFGQSEDVRAVRSFKLGAIRTTREAFADPDRIKRSEVERCRDDIRSALSAFAHRTRNLGFDVAVGCSGTIQTVARMALAEAGRSTLTLNAHEMTRREVERVVERLVAAKTRDERAAIEGLDSDRVDIVVAGALILAGVMDAFGIDRLTVSEGSLREGLLIDTWRRRAGKDLSHLRDLRRDSVVRLMESCDEDPAHARKLADLADQLWLGLQPLHGLSAEHRELLGFAALLANVGLVVSHSRHHHHAYYIIRHSDRLSGFTDREIEMLALLARFHRKAAPSEERHEELTELSMVERAVVKSMSAILRLAVALDRSHSGAVEAAEVRLTAEAVVVELQPVNGADLALEVYSAQGRLGFMQDVFGRPFEVRVAAS